MNSHQSHYKFREKNTFLRFYFPFLFYYIYLSFKAKNLTFFTICNPGMYLGGFDGESKREAFEQIDKKYLPKMIFIKKESKSELFKNQNKLLEKLKKEQIDFPCIMKPNIGHAGNGVKKIKDIKTAIAYIQENSTDTIIQERIGDGKEITVMYKHNPEKEKGNIDSIIRREYLEIIGDGESTFAQLIKKHKRGKHFRKKILKAYYKESSKIIKKGDKRVLKLGNLRMGTKQISHPERITKKIENIFNTIGQNIHEFYLGRYDIKIASEEDFLKGNFKILELNGVGANPMDAYSHKNTLWKSQKIFFKHRKSIYEICMANHKRGIEYIPFFKTIKMYKAIKNN